MEFIFERLFGMDNEDESSTLSKKVESETEKDDKKTDQVDEKKIIESFLSDHTRFFSVIPDMNYFQPSTSPMYSLIKGAIQSGKSEMIHALSLYFALIHKSTTVLILRDFVGDYDQMNRGLQRFLNRFHSYLCLKSLEEEIDLPTIHYVGDIRRDKDGVIHGQTPIQHALVNGGSILIALANADQMMKLNESWDSLLLDSFPALQLIIDESDQLMFSEGVRFTPQLDALTRKASHIIGISATHYEHFQDVKHRFETSRILVMKPPPPSLCKGTYKGILDIQYEYIQPIDIKKKKESDNLLERDPDLYQFLENHKSHDPFHIHNDQQHPMITLVKQERLILQQNKMMESIRQRFKELYTIIIYNGKEVTLYSDSLKEYTTLTLPKCQKRTNRCKSQNGVHVFSNVSIVYVLQYLKENGGANRFPRILIIAHGLVGRGIQIVSEDYEWHLTHMYYRPSSSTRASAYLQDMRLCGIYRDSIPLTCVLEKKTYHNLYKSYMLQEDLFGRIQDESSENLTQWLSHQTIFNQKIPHCHVVRAKFKANITRTESEDHGMSFNEFNHSLCITKMNPILHSKDVDIGPDMDKKEYDRLIHLMFKKWANHNNQSAIARFMRDGLDPRKEYTKSEMLDLCKIYGIQLGHITGVRKGGQIHGQLIDHDPVKQIYRLYPCLIPSFETFF